jgi:hypothetical protein
MPEIKTSHETSTQNSDPNVVLKGFDGAPCSISQVMQATNAMNNLNEGREAGVAQIFNGFRDIPWECAAEHITDPRVVDSSTSVTTSSTSTTPITSLTPKVSIESLQNRPTDPVAQKNNNRLFVPASNRSRPQIEYPQFGERLDSLNESINHRIEEIRSSVVGQRSVNLNQCSLNLSLTANMFQDAGLLAGTLNNPQVQQQLIEIGMGLGRISSGMSILAMPSASPITMAGGMLAVTAGLAVIGSSLFGRRGRKDINNGLGQALVAIMGALQQLGHMVEQVLKNQDRIYGTLQVTLHMVLDLETRLKQQHIETQAAHTFIATKDLQDALLSIQGDLDETNAISLTETAKTSALTTLEHWLRQHLQMPFMNRLSSGPTTPKLTIEILSTTPQAPWLSIGFVVGQLKSHLGQAIPSRFLSLPPFALFVQTARIFLQGLAKAKLPSDDAGASICRVIQQQINLYQDFITFLKTSPQIWLAMFDLYEYKRNMVGRAICNADIANNNATLNEQVIQDVKRLQLINALDAMESIRLLIKTMGQYVGSQPEEALSSRINNLESKATILALKGTMLHELRANYHSAIEAKDTKGVIAALRSGVSASAPYTYGTPLNHIFYSLYSTWGRSGPNPHQYSLDLLFQFAKNATAHANKEEVLNFTSMGTCPYRGQGDYFYTWWATNSASRLMLNNGHYAGMLLQIAMGYEPHWLSAEVLGNLPASVAAGSVYCIETMMILSSTIDTHGVLNAEKLRKAFTYYQAMDRGELCIAEEIAESTIDLNCLLWLICLLGRWHIFESLALPDGFDFSKTLGDFQFYYEGHYRFSGCAGHNGMYTTQICEGPVHSTKTSVTTALMVAAEHGRVDVIESLIRKYQDGKDIGLLKVWSDGTSAATKAFMRGFFDIAKRLHDLGAPLSAEHVDQLATKGLQGGPLIVPVKNEITELHALTARTELIGEEKILSDLSTLVNEAEVLFEQELVPPVRVVVADTRDEQIAELRAALEESNRRSERLFNAVEALLARAGSDLLNPQVIGQPL